MKVGDSFPAKQVRGKKCPKCGDAVFKTYPTGFVIETSTVVSVDGSGATVKDAYHCPACGKWEYKTRDITLQGIEKSFDTQTEAKYEPSNVNSGFEFTTSSTNSSDKSKRRKRKQK